MRSSPIKLHISNCYLVSYGRPEGRIGRLGTDVDLRYTITSQKAVAKMPVAVNDQYGMNERACPPSAPPSGEAAGSTGFR
jgi:hypothetical protein